MGVFSFVKAGKKVFEIVKPKIAKNLAKKRKIQDEKTQNTSEILEGLSPEGKISVRTNNPLSKFNKKIADIYDEKAKGGRVGLRKGTPNPFGKKSNIQKIQEVFGVKKAKKKEKPKKRMMAMGGGMMGRRMGYASGTLKPIPEGNKGLPKLPK